MYRVPVTEALLLIGATCKASGLYQRLLRLRAREAAEEELAVAEYNRKIDNNAAAALVCLGGQRRKKRGHQQQHCRQRPP
jgi:hypothetical protein